MHDVGISENCSLDLHGEIRQSPYIKIPNQEREHSYIPREIRFSNQRVIPIEVLTVSRLLDCK